MLDPDYIQDLFAAIGPVTVRRMFGGQGIHHDGLMVALVATDVIYLKTGPETVGAFEQAGSEPFSYLAKGRPRVITSYWRLPEAALDDPDLFREWAERALTAARQADAAKPKKSKSRKKRAATE